MFRDFHANPYIKSTAIGEDISFQIKLRYPKTPGTAVV
jgi:hypothetical protein